MECNAALAILEAPEDEIRGEAINVGSNEQNHLIRKLAELLSEITGCAVEVAEEATADQRSYRVDFTKLGRVFPDLTFDWDARQGASELVDAHRGIGLTREDFDGDRYVRLRRLRHLLDEGAIDAALRWQAAAVS